MKLAMPKISLSGRFKIQKKKNDKIIYDGDWFNNLITNNGLDLMATNASRYNRCCAGSGNTPPAVTDISIENFVGVSDVNPVNSTTVNLTDYYISHVRTFVFSVGAVVGNISELTVGPNSDGTNVFSRTLVKDNEGVPTSISILADEQLIVSWEIRYYFPTDDILLNVDGYSIVLRPCNVDFSQAWGDTFNFSTVAPMTAASGGVNSSLYAALFINGVLGSITEAPSGTVRYQTGFSAPGYVAGTYQRTCTFRWNPSGSSGSVTCFRFMFNVLGMWQFSISPAINKTLDDQLEIDVGISWGRQGEI